MSESTTAARKCFEENIRFFGNAKAQPEKYNLYNGLRNLAQAIQGLDEAVRILQRKCDEIALALRK